MTIRATFSFAFISMALLAQQGLNPAKLLEPPTMHGPCITATIPGADIAP